MANNIKNSKERFKLETSLAASMLYYDLEEYKKFSGLWTKMESNNSYSVSGTFEKFIDMTRMIFTEENKDDISFVFVMSKLRYFNSLDPNSEKSAKFDSWLDDISKSDDSEEFELGESLFYKYVWEIYKEDITRIDRSDISYKEKLLVEPVKIDYTEVDNIFIRMDDPIDDKKLSDIGFLMGSNALDGVVTPFLSNLVIIAARPGVGKSTLMLKMALENAKKGIKGTFFSLEMSREQIERRILAWYKGRFVSKEEGEIVKQEEEYKRISDNFVYISNYSDNGNVVFDIAKMSVKKHGSQAIYIDYLQLVKYPGKDEWAAIRETTSRLKSFATNNNVIVVTCSQLSRKSENYGISLADLYGGSTIEADGDIVIAIERSEREMPDDSIKMGEIMVLKYRDGASNIKFGVMIDYIRQEFNKYDMGEM